jgi:hypothetical protein
MVAIQYIDNMYMYIVYVIPTLMSLLILAACVGLRIYVRDM